MKRFRFVADFTANASNLEALLSNLSNHLATMARHAGSGRSEADVCSLFKVEEVKVDEAAEEAALKANPDFDDGTVDLRHDHITAEHGPIELDLDPKSTAGIARAEQLVREKSEREAQKAALANVGRSDADIMAEHSAKEQADLNNAG
jgi:hypothetical protein